MGSTLVRWVGWVWCGLACWSGKMWGGRLVRCGWCGMVWCGMVLWCVYNESKAIPHVNTDCDKGDTNICHFRSGLARRRGSLTLLHHFETMHTIAYLGITHTHTWNLGFPFPTLSSHVCRTAVGDLVRTVIVDSTVMCRMRRSDVISVNIQPGDVIVGMQSFGQARCALSFSSCQ